MTTLTPVTVAQCAVRAGWTGTNLITAVAVSFAEDQAHESGAHYAPGTGESSWGLWQVNVGGSLWHDRVHLAQAHGLALTNPVQLTDPQTNANMAYWLWERDGWGIWATYLHRKYLDHWGAAVAAVAAALSHPGGVVLTRYLLQMTPMQSGHDVAAWQLVCGAKPDGWFGPATKQATVTWQARHHDRMGRPLVPDGVVGPLTAAAAGWTWAPR